MAVTKLWPVKRNLAKVLEYVKDKEKTDKRKFEQKFADKTYSASEHQSLQNVLAYAVNEEKTDRKKFARKYTDFECQSLQFVFEDLKDEEPDEKILFYQGINCNPTTALEQFVTVKEQYGKADGIQAYHGYLSFKEQDITPELAQQIGMEFAQEVWGERFQVVVTTHMNTQHLHCHFVLNSVSFADGKRAHGKETSWFQFSKVADRICEKYGLHTVKKKERNPSPKTMERRDKAGALTPWNITRAAIDDAISRSRSFAEMEDALRQMGYTFDFNPNHKYWTIVPKGSKKSVRLYRLGEQYTPDAINRRLAENLRRMKGKPYTPPPKTKQVRRTRSSVDRILSRRKKRGGLMGLYLHYLYLLGKLPTRRQVNPVKVHYALREDLLKLDEITAQTRLLCEHGIGTTEELTAYRQSLANRVQALSTQRRTLRNTIRRASTKEMEVEMAIQQIESINQELKELRQEAKHCDRIAERSGVIAEKLDQIREEENKQQGKETPNYEYERR